MTRLEKIKAVEVLKVKIDEICKFEFRKNSKWSRDCKKIKGDKCAVCGWNNTTCDAHHIVPLSEGGKNNICNCIILCPNHHAEIHRPHRS